MTFTSNQAKSVLTGPAKKKYPTKLIQRGFQITSEWTQNTIHEIIIPRIWKWSTSILWERNSIKTRFAQWHTPIKKQYIYIKYTPQRTIQAWWYLVQVDLESTYESNINVKEQGMHYWIFLDKHTDNQGKSNGFRIW